MARGNIGRFLAFILRHKPESVGIALDEHGWADIDLLIEGMNATGTVSVDRDIILAEVAKDNKGRYAISPDGKRIRARQGHSIEVDAQLTECTPPPVLYHGTGEKYAASIDTEGLISKTRLYVHLSGDIETARNVGSRHGAPVIYSVDCAKMSADGYIFLLSENGVWNTKEVPAVYLTKVAAD